MLAKVGSSCDFQPFYCLDISFQDDHDRTDSSMKETDVNFQCWTFVFNLLLCLDTVRLGLSIKTMRKGLNIKATILVGSGQHHCLGRLLDFFFFK